MKTTLRNILAVVLGLAGGSLVNMALIMVSGQVIPPPAGADITTMEGLKQSIHLFEAKHFLFPFLAHALGTLAGTCIAALTAASRQSAIAFVIGGFFLVGGIANILMLPSPTWFTAADLLLAYLPMAWVAARVVSGKSKKKRKS